MSAFDHAIASLLAACTAIMLVIIGWYASLFPFALTPLNVSLIVVGVVFIENAGLALAGILAQKLPFFRNLGRFTATGIFNTTLDTGALSLLSYATGVYAGVRLAGLNVIAFALVTFVSYAINRSWSFASPRPASAREFGVFVTVVVSSMLINTGIVFVITSLVSAPSTMSPAQWVVVAKIVGVAFSILWNFAWMHKLVFKAQREADASTA